MSIHANTAIHLLGGVAKTASFFGVTAGAVSQWREKGIPPARAQTIKYARPDIYAAALRAAQEDTAHEAA